MNPIRAALTAALILQTLVLASCRTPVPPLATLPHDDQRPTALLDDWNALAAERQSLRGGAKLAVDGKRGRRGERDLSLRVRQRLAIERPARMRVEIEGFLGATLAVFTTNGERYQLYEFMSRNYVSGEVHDGLLWEVARLDLEPAEIVDVLLGAPRPDLELTIQSAWDAGEGGVRIALADADSRVRRQLQFDADGLLRWLEMRDESGEAIWEALFDEYAPVAEHDMAHLVTLKLQGGRTQAVLSLYDLELNPEIPASVFEIRAPSTTEGSARGAAQSP